MTLSVVTGITHFTVVTCSFLFLVGTMSCVCVRACVCMCVCVLYVCVYMYMYMIELVGLEGLRQLLCDDAHHSCPMQVAPEEFHSTLSSINSILQKNIPLNLKFLICGCLCCCCTLGVSLGPVLCLNKRVGLLQTVTNLLSWFNTS